MKELYISPELNVICFAPVERLATDNELVQNELLLDISVYGANEPGASIEDDDFGLDIL
ncbi:MAG: hypothetical protein IKU57_00435 [Oscillospiraceae bacterium]|nr:hypothetical protein [Oscillospiraceae bacterium]